MGLATVLAVEGGEERDLAGGGYFKNCAKAKLPALLCCSIEVPVRSFDQSVRKSATSLSQIAGHKFDLTDVLLAIAHHLQRTLQSRNSHTFATFRAEYDQHHALAGQKITVVNPGLGGTTSSYVNLAIIAPLPITVAVNPANASVVVNGTRQFSAIVANTSYHWRDHSSQVLSTEFLQIVRQHLLAGGIYYYNATESPDVLITGLHEYKYGVRIITFLMVSDSAIVLDKEHWFSILNQYEIDGKKMFPSDTPRGQLVLAAYSAFADTIKDPPRVIGLESGDALATRLGARHIISDDNMGAEWTGAHKPNWR